MAALKEKDASKIQSATSKLQKSMVFDEKTAATYKKVLAALLQAYTASVPEVAWPSWLTEKQAAKIIRKNQDNPYLALADFLYNESFLGNPEKWQGFLNNPSVKSAEKDPGFQLAQSYPVSYTHLRAHET